MAWESCLLLARDGYDICSLTLEDVGILYDFAVDISYDALTLCCIREPIFLKLNEIDFGMKTALTITSCCDQQLGAPQCGVGAS